MNEHLRATVEKLIRASGGWVLAECRRGEECFSVDGPLGDVEPGETWALDGNWADRSRSWPRFRAKSGSPTTPDTIDELVALVRHGQFPAMCVREAERLVHRYGDRLWAVLLNDPDLLLSDPAVPKEKVRTLLAVAAQLQNRWNWISWFAQHNVPSHLFAPILKYLEGQQLDRFREDPYCLISWLSWGKVDCLARHLGIGPSDERRISAAILWTLTRRLQDGHTAMTCAELAKCIQKLTHVPAAQVLGTIREPLVFVINGMAQLPTVAEQERAVARAFVRMMLEPKALADRAWVEGWIERYENHTASNLDPDQREAIYAAVSGRVLVLTGGPGTGKTTVIRAICCVLEDLGQRVLLAAPTGRAARRLHQATGRDTSTLHRLFCKSQGNGEPSVGRGGECTLIVDECSMVDLRLWHMIAKSAGETNRLLVVGDSAQLPPVGPGTVFSDLERSLRVRAVKLTTVHRQSSDNPIPHVAAAIQDGCVPFLRGWGHELQGVYFIPQNNELKGLRWIVRLMLDALPRAGITLDDVQVLAPTKGGFTGTTSINTAVRDALGKNGPFPFVPGDRVMQTVNDYHLGGHGIMNGTAGRVVESDDRRLLVDFEGEPVEVTTAARHNLEHAYAVTVHKSQGSQFRAVVIPLYTSAGLLLTRSVLYTAVTRATDLVIIVGDSRALELAVTSRCVTERGSAFRHHLEECASLMSNIVPGCAGRPS